jgi:DNA-binding CsgD family transcriptional regulator/tetratricopeptide (TPR) repeat protein
LEARQVAEKGVQRIHDTAGGSIRSMRFIRLNLAEVYFDLGEWELADAELREAQAGETEGMGAAHAHLRTTQLALARGRDEEARTALEVADRLLKDALEPQYIAILASLGAELEVRAGNPERAREAIDSGIDRMLFCSDDATRLGLVAAEGVAVEAEIAERACDLGDSEAEAEARRRADRHLEMVRAATEDGERRVERALLATTEAQQARTAHADDPRLWADAAAAWERLDRPYPKAIALWRQAQASLARGDRAAAAPPLARASAIAGKLGAAWLAGETGGLAARARISLEERPAAGGNGAAGEPEDETPFGLTPRELQVLELVGSGATNREIGERLYMAEKTASVHVSRILSKLGVRGRTEAAAVAHRHGIGAEVEG